jgi:hypothetical protein
MKDITLAWIPLTLLGFIIIFVTVVFYFLPYQRVKQESDQVCFVSKAMFTLSEEEHCFLKVR